MIESEIIDKLLVWYAVREGGYPVEETGEMGAVHTKAKNKMVSYNLIELRGKLGFYFLTEVGYAAYNAGGFDKWLEENQRKIDQLHQATIDASKATVDAADSAKNSKYAAWVAAVAAIAAFLYPLISTEKREPRNNADSTINVLNQRVDTLRSQLKDLSQIPKAKATDQQTRKKK